MDLCYACDFNASVKVRPAGKTHFVAEPMVMVTLVVVVEPATLKPVLIGDRYIKRELLCRIRGRDSWSARRT